MRQMAGKLGWASHWMVAALMLAMVGHAKATALIVPAYFDPSTNAAEWASLTAAASQTKVVAIINPNSGPGSSADPSYAAAINAFRAAGGIAIGYVHTQKTSGGLRKLSTVEAEVDQYKAFYGTLDGVFVDEMTNSTSSTDLNFYGSLYNYIKGENPKALVVGNPGTNVPQAYAAVADVLVTYESPLTDYQGYTASPWAAGQAATHFAQMVYNVDGTSLQSTLQQITSQNVNYVYVTDDTLPNPYDSLPSYWSAEVAAVVPEPALLGVGGAAVLLLTRRPAGRLATDCR